MTATMTAPAMTTQLVEYRNQEALGAAATFEQFSAMVDLDWAVPLVQRVLDLERRHPTRVTKAISERAVEIIRHLACSELDLMDATPFIGPVADGGLIFEWANRGRQLNIALFPEGTTEYLQWEADDHFNEGVLPVRPRAKLGELISWLTSAVA